MLDFQLKNIISFCFLLLVSNTLYGQDKSLINRANKLFEEEKFVECNQDFLKIISLQPKNADFNYKYGVCLLYSDKDKQKAIRYLNFAVKNPSINPRAYYFKGRAHHLNYQFSEAKKWYQKYQEKKNPKDRRFDIQQVISQCENGKKLMQSFTDIIVSEKKQIDEKQFFRLYHKMETIGGQILVAERFQSKLDKKRGHVPLVHFPDAATSIYYSSYGEDDSKGLDIYTRKRLPDGSWGKPFRLQGGVNTPFDDNFPYLHPSGNMLYFSSKGHNSMGGYDVFSAEKNKETDLFEGVKNVDFAISSPDDDMFYVVDSLFENAYFASARQSEQGKLHVYYVKVARVPLRDVIVMGDFTSEINPENKKMQVTVFNAISGEKVGTIKTNRNGEYSFVFPRGGKYKYSIQVEGASEPTFFSFDVPFLEELRPLKQSIVNKGDGTLQVQNKFDERIEGGEEILAQIIRKKAELNVNIDDFDSEELKQIEAKSKEKEVLTELGYENHSLTEISTEFERLEKGQEHLEQRLSKIEAVGQSKQLELASEIVELSNQVEKTQNQVDNSDNVAKKRTLLKELAELQSSIDKKSKQLERIVPVDGQELREQLKITDSFDKVSKKFNQLVENGKEEEALSFLAENKTAILAQKEMNSESVVEKLIQEKITVSEQIQEERNSIENNNKEITVLQTEIQKLEKQLSSAKTKEIPSIEQKLEENKEEIKIFETSNASKKSKIEALTIKGSELSNTIDVLQTDVENISVPNQDELGELLVQAGNIAESQKEKSAEKQLKELNVVEATSSEAVEKTEKEITKTTVLKEVNSDYESTKEWFSSIEEPTVEMIKDQIILEESNQEKIQSLLASIQNSDNEADKEKVKMLQELLEDSENREKELKEQKVETEFIKDDETPDLTAKTETKNVVEEIDDAFASKMETIESSTQSYFEKQLEIQQLEEEKKAFIEDKITVSSNDAEKEAWETQLSIQENVLSEKEGEILRLAVKEDNTEWLYSIDKKYAKSIEKASTVEAKKAVENEHLTKLKEAVHSSEELSFDQKVENAILNNAITQTENRIAELASQTPSETIDSENWASEMITQNFAERKKTIESSTQSDFEKQLEIQRLEEEKKTFIEDKITVSSSDAEKEAWETQLSIQENVLSEKEEEILRLTVKEDNTEWLHSIDKKYAKSIEKASTVEAKKAVENEHLTKLKEAVHSSEELSFDQKVENAILNDAIAQTENRIAELEVKESISISDFIVQSKKRNQVEFVEENELSAMDLEAVKAYVQQLESYETELEKKKLTLDTSSDIEAIDIEMKKVAKQKRRAMILIEDVEQLTVSGEIKGVSTDAEELKSVEELSSKVEQSTLSSVQKNVLESQLDEVKEVENQFEKAKSEQEKVFLTEQINKESAKINAFLSYEDEAKKIEDFEEENEVKIESLASLQKRKRRVVILVGELEKSLRKNRSEQEKAKRKELPKLKSKEMNLTDAIAEKQQEIYEIDKEIEERTKNKVDVFETAISTEVTFKEERDLATTETYKKYVEEAEKAVKIQKEINRLEIKKSSLQSEIQLNVKSGVEVGASQIEELKTIEKTILSKKEALNLTDKTANALLSSNEVEALKMKNLAFRKIQPIETYQSPLEVVKMPRSGFEIDKSSSASSIYSSENPIPIDVSSPEGLVYRVQIGAFGRPIPQDLFKEFTPVSGEKIGNTGITRYMAGFFNSSETVVEAREEIRSLGYSDAFVVAYCDGERISLSEARTLEREGKCESKQMNELIIEVAEKTAEKQGVQLKKEVQSVSEYAYNKVPGAVEAEPIELMKGLFFTVQVGAYYRPVGSKTLFNLPEIKSYRAPNGMIKYCTGIFNSSTEARPRQRQARTVGIEGAFIVAYLDGERISLSEARNVLATNPEKLYANQPQDKNEINEVADTELEKENIINVTPKVKPTPFYQWISKDDFSEYPEQLMSRLNENGNFYFDTEENKVKSSIRERKEKLISGFELKEVDPLSFSENLEIIVEQETIPGEIMDWFVRQNALKSIRKEEGNIHLILSEVEMSEMEKMDLEIQKFNVNYEWK